MRQFNQTNQRPLSNDEILLRAPSVGATTASERVSSQYRMIPTLEVVNALRKENWAVMQATEQRVMSEQRRGFQKHFLRFRQLGDLGGIQNVGDSVIEIVLTNGHDGTAAYNFHAGLFRLACSNGLVVADGTFQKISIVHKGFEPGQVIEASYKMLSDLPKIKDAVESMRGIEINNAEREAFAKSALLLKYENEEAAPIKSDRLLKSYRAEDQAPNLWNTFNVVQENLIRGGQRGFDKNMRRTTTREVKGIDSNIKLNKALWSLAEEMKKIKAAA